MSLPRTGEPFSPPATDPVPVDAARVHGDSADATVGVDVQTIANEGNAA